MSETTKAVNPWETEPDELAWRTAAGLQGAILRNSVGALCGYAGVSREHPWYGDSYDDKAIDVHGELTYAGELRRLSGVEDSADFWWFGFDCAHSNDLIPRIPICSWGVYRDMDYVKGQVESLARQLVAAGRPGNE